MIVRTMLGPMVGIGVNEETHAQPQDPNIYINARYMPHINTTRVQVLLQIGRAARMKYQIDAPNYYFWIRWYTFGAIQRHIC